MVQTRDHTPPQATLTLEEFLALPETKPASEFINGKIHQKTMPQGKHGAIQAELTVQIYGLRRQKIARVITELRCTFGDRAIVPDLAVFKWDNIARDADGSIANAFTWPPDWTIEILSPGQSPSRPTRNIFHCLEHGCVMGWLIMPEDEFSVVVYTSQGASCLGEPGDHLPVPEFAGELEITIQDLMDCLQD